MTNKNGADERKYEVLGELASRILELANENDIVHYRVGDEPQDFARRLSLVLSKAHLPRTVTDEKVTIENNHVEGFKPSEYDGKFVLFTDVIYKDKHFNLLGHAVKSAKKEGKIYGAAYINALETQVVPYDDESLRKLNREPV